MCEPQLLQQTLILTDNEPRGERMHDSWHAKNSITARASTRLAVATQGGVSTFWERHGPCTRGLNSIRWRATNLRMFPNSDVWFLSSIEALGISVLCHIHHHNLQHKSNCIRADDVPRRSRIHAQFTIARGTNFYKNSSLPI